MSTGYPSSWPHPTTRVTGDTIYAHESPTAKPGHALARPGHCLVRLRRLGDFHRRKRNASAQRIPQCIFSTVKLVAHLQVHPESRGCAEVARETHRSVGRNAPLPMDDFVDTTGRNTDSDGELVLRSSEALNEALHKDFTRVNRSNFSGSQRSQPLLDHYCAGCHTSRLPSPRTARVCPNMRTHAIARRLRLPSRSPCLPCAHTVGDVPLPLTIRSEPTRNTKNAAQTSRTFSHTPTNNHTNVHTQPRPRRSF